MLLKNRVYPALLGILFVIVAAASFQDAGALTPTPAPTQPRPVAITLRTLPLHSGPGTGYPVVRDVAPGTPLTIHAITEDGLWARVTADPAEWLALSRLVEIQGDLNTVELVMYPPATPQPTLDMNTLVSTVQVAVVETLIAQAQGTAIAQATQTAAQQATAIAIQNMPVDVSQDDDPAIGPEDAPVVIIEFSDFTCPYCGRFARETLPRILADYEDQVRFVYRDAPILGPTSMDAALAAECAYEQDAFWPYHDLLFESQQNLRRDTFLQFASQLELDMEAFTTCFDNATYRDEISRDLQDAQAAGLTGTPTLFVNGRRVVGAQPFEVFAQYIEEELAKAR